NRLGDNDKISPQRPILDIATIKCDTSGVSRIASSADLPDTRQPGSSAEVEIDVRAIQWNFVKHDRPRTNHAHLSTQHVDQLREFVDTELAQHRSDRCNARVILQLATGGPFSCGVGR